MHSQQKDTHTQLPMSILNRVYAVIWLTYCKTI